MNKKVIIGLSAYAQTGKDTVCNCLKSYFLNQNIPFYRVALADALKDELDDFCIKHYGISSFENNKVKKDMVRSFLIFHGNLKRNLSNGRYWCEKVEKKINSGPNGVYCVTDIRYNDLGRDEVKWLQDEQGGSLVYLERMLDDGSIYKSSIKEELERMPGIKERSDIIANIRTLDDPEKGSDLLMDIQPLCHFINKKV